MNLTHLNSAFFIGIGGIGMSAIARWFNYRGVKVTGYDRTPSALIDQLQAEGIEVHFEDDPQYIPAEVYDKAVNNLVVYTPAIPKDHKQYNYLKAHGVEVYKRSEVLGEITKRHFTIAVAGTHGKTTTSSMIIHLLKDAQQDCCGFIGGILSNYESNLVMNGDQENCMVVVEADEYDRSFLRLHPNVAVITSADPDHLDIYGEADALEKAFRDFIAQIKPQGKLFVNDKVASKLVNNLQADIEVSVYGFSVEELTAKNIKILRGNYYFDYYNSKSSIDELFLQLPGRHNVENAIAAVSVAKSLGIGENQIKDSLKNFKGVKRRFETVLKKDNLVFVDDYAHHPEEISSFIGGLRELYPTQKITAIFQPHLYTRTRDFASGFAASLDQADEVILLEIYPARELPITGVSSQMIADLMGNQNKAVIAREDLLGELNNRSLEVVATIGAGDIDRLVAPIKEMLLNED